MQFPRVLKLLLQEFQSGPKSIGSGGLDHLSADARSEMTMVLSLASIGQLSWQNETSIIAVWRAFLSILPASALEHPEDRCKEKVRARLRHLLGEDPEPDDLQTVVAIVKRLQRYRRGGRMAISSTSFDPEYASHRALLRTQDWRCKCCGYRFKQVDVYRDHAVDAEDGHFEPSETIDHPLGPSDRSPPRLFRKAQLDHVLPIYLAGDNESNWQILCRSCNLGKSDMVLGFENRDWFGHARLTDLVGTNNRMFYMVLRRDGKCATCGRGPMQIEMRLRRLDPAGADLYTNLTGHCVACFGT